MAILRPEIAAAWLVRGALAPSAPDVEPVECLEDGLAIHGAVSHTLLQPVRRRRWNAGHHPPTVGSSGMALLHVRTEARRPPGACVRSSEQRGE
jgi:hypothetical protein